MYITTNKHNGQTISLPFVLSDFNVQGLNGLIYDIENFCDNYMTVGTYYKLWEGCTLSEDTRDIDHIDNALQNLEYMLNQLNLEHDIIISLDDCVYTITLQSED